MLSAPSSNALSLKVINTQLSWLSSYLYECSSPSLPFFSILFTGFFPLASSNGPNFLLLALLSPSLPNILQGTPFQNTQHQVRFFLSSNPTPSLCSNLDPFHFPSENHPIIPKSFPNLPLQPHLIVPHNHGCTPASSSWMLTAFILLYILFSLLDTALNLQLSAQLSHTLKLSLLFLRIFVSSSCSQSTLYVPIIYSMYHVSTTITFSPLPLHSCSCLHCSLTKGTVVYSPLYVM